MAEVRYGLNIVAGQITDPITQEAFRDQERVNLELKTKIDESNAELRIIKDQIDKLAEAVKILLDSD